MSLDLLSNIVFISPHDKNVDGWDGKVEMKCLVGPSRHLYVNTSYRDRICGAIQRSLRARCSTLIWRRDGGIRGAWNIHPNVDVIVDEIRQIWDASLKYGIFPGDQGRR